MRPFGLVLLLEALPIVGAPRRRAYRDFQKAVAIGEERENLECRSRKPRGGDPNNVIVVIALHGV